MRLRVRFDRYANHFRSHYLENSPVCACREFPVYSSKLRLLSPKHLPSELDHVCLLCARDICSSIGPEMGSQLRCWLPGIDSELNGFYHDFYTDEDIQVIADSFTTQAYDRKCLDHQRYAAQLLAKFTADSDKEEEEGESEEETKPETNSTEEKKEKKEEEENGKRKKKKKKKKRQGRKAKKVERMPTLEEREDEGDHEVRETGQEQEERGQEEGKGKGEDGGESDGEGEEKEEAEEGGGAGAGDR